MKRPTAFVSSTCFDLRQLRSAIKDSLEQMGLEPVLSEFETFPIDPAVGTIDNCLKNVADRADIFILIIGGRYGSTKDGGKSVTNLEYLTAKAKGIPIYTFVARSVLDIIPIWKANPTADFSSAVDSPKLLDFVTSIRDGGECWVFPFDLAQEISKILKIQLAYLFKDSLELRLRCKSGGLSTRLMELHGSALRLVIERPRAWEYSLFADLLAREFRELQDLRRDWQYSLAQGPGLGFRNNAVEVLDWIPLKLDEITRLATNLENLFNKVFVTAVGPPGVSGDPETIQYVANRIASAYKDAMEWKLNFLRVSVPPEMNRLWMLTSKFGDNSIKDLEDFVSKLTTSLEVAISSLKAGAIPEPITLMLNLTPPDQTEFHAEIEKIRQSYKKSSPTAD